MPQSASCRSLATSPRFTRGVPARAQDRANGMRPARAGNAGRHRIAPPAPLALADLMAFATQTSPHVPHAPLHAARRPR